MEEKNEIKEEKIIEPAENVSNTPKEKSKLLKVLIFILGIFLHRACMVAIKTSIKPPRTVSPFPKLEISELKSNSTFGTYTTLGTYTVQDGKVIMKTLEGSVFGSFYIDSSDISFDILREGDKGDFSSSYKFEDEDSFSQTETMYYPNSNKLMEATFKINFSDSALKKLKEISHDKNKVNRFLSSLEKMESFSFKSYAATVFYEDGNIMRTVESKNSMGNGLVKSYYKNGNLESVTEIDNRITPNGKYEEFYENGKLALSTTFKNGIEDGKHEEFHENGKLALSTTFKNGIQDGICEIYNENGKLVNKIYMKNWEVLKR